MAPLLTPSPVLVDHSFPRSELELRRVATALGELAGCIERGEAELLLTQVLIDFLELFDSGTESRPYGLIQDIYGLLSTWFLQRSEGITMVEVDDISTSTPHRVPSKCSRDGLVDLWSVEVGKLLVAHDEVADNREFFVGVACDFGFSGSPVDHYPPPEQRSLPLVDKESFKSLDDSYRWVICDDVHLRLVTFRDAKRNVSLLGATSVKKPRSGSHHMVVFPGERSWPLDSNVDPIPDKFLKELVTITGYPLAVIKTVLLTGASPEKSPKFEKRLA